MSTCLVVPYYGPFPKWMPLFLRSVELNPALSVALVSTDSAPFRLPPNVRHVAMPLSELERRVRDRVSADFRLRWAYKLCDLKPFYGLIFDDLVSEFDHWGYCDVDLVFGRVDRRLSAARLSNVDVFTADAGPAIGHLAVYRNDRDVNRLGFRIPDYDTKLKSPDCYQLDETELTPVLMSTPQLRWDRSRDLTESQLTITSDGRMMGRTSGVVGDPDAFYWENGGAFVSAGTGAPQEVLYLHFMGLKRAYHWGRYDPDRTYDDFAFSAAGFQPWRVAPNVVERYRVESRAAILRQVGRARTAVALSLSNEQRRRAKRAIAKTAQWLRRGASAARPRVGQPRSR